MGRLWQTLILTNWNRVFNWLPVETIIRNHQDEYYRILATCDKAGNSTSFIEFMLQTILEACGGVKGGASGGVKSLDDQIVDLLKFIKNPIRANNIAIQLDASQRTVERALQRLKGVLN